MSQLTVNTLQLGQSATPANNFVLTVPSPADGTIKLARGNVGSTTQDVISVNAAGEVSFPATGTFGKILQVAQTVITSASSTNSTSFVDLGALSVSITPASASNKVLVLVDIKAGSFSNGFFRLVRNGNNIYLGDSYLSTVQTSGTDSYFPTTSITSIPMIYLDSPSSTSSVTYKIQVAAFSGSYPVFFNASYLGANAGYAIRSASSITVMEVAP
jgi:hypothetical protein